MDGILGILLGTLVGTVLFLVGAGIFYFLVEYLPNRPRVVKKRWGPYGDDNKRSYVWVIYKDGGYIELPRGYPWTKSYGLQYATKFNTKEEAKVHLPAGPYQRWKNKRNYKKVKADIDKRLQANKTKMKNIDFSHYG